MCDDWDTLVVDRHCENIGVMFYRGINEFGLSPETMTDYFIRSGVADLMSNWHPRLSGEMNGTELLLFCLKCNGLNPPIISDSKFFTVGQEYWAGYMLAEYQWFYEYRFKEILDKVPFEKIVESYYPLHEASEEKFFDTMEHWMGKI